MRLCKANALVYSENKHELLTQLVNADAHGCASQCDARGRPGRCPRCAAKLHLVCSPSDLQPNQPIRLECRNRLFKKGGQTMGGARSCIGSAFERCGWKADITAENKRELLSVRIKDSWEGDLLPVPPSSEPESAGMGAPKGATELPVALQYGPPSPTPPPSTQEPKRLRRSASSSSNEESLAICDDAPAQASSDGMSEDQPDDEDLELEDEKAQEQEYLARERRAEAVREAVAGSWLGRELASAAYDRVMNGEDEEDEEIEEDEDEETQEANAWKRYPRVMSAVESVLGKRARDVEGE